MEDVLSDFGFAAPAIKGKGVNCSTISSVFAVFSVHMIAPHSQMDGVSVQVRPKALIKSVAEIMGGLGGSCPPQFDMIRKLPPIQNLNFRHCIKLSLPIIFGSSVNLFWSVAI